MDTTRTIRQWKLLRGQARDDAFLPDESGVLQMTARLPDGWADASFAVLPMKAYADHQVEALLGFCARETDEPLLELHYRALCRCEVRLPFPVDGRALLADYAFLPPWPGVFKGGMRGRSIRPDEVQWVRLTIRKPSLTRVEVRELRFQNQWTPEDVKGEVLVDALGQRKAGEWPGKTADLAALKAYLKAELEAAKRGGAYPEGWSAYGGWTRKRFQGTGWFRREHDGRRWWLVDPDGCAFFSNGMCYGNRTGIYAMADHLDSLYEWLPPREGLLSGARATGENIPQYVVRNGLGSAKKRELVNLPRANMMRVFGEDWLDAWITINASRMREWGVNTLGIGVNDYADEPTRRFLQQSGIPYVLTFKFFALTKERIFRDFPDVFSEEYARATEDMARRELTPYLSDNRLIGYFLTNEPEWLMQENVDLTMKLMTCAGCAASRRAMANFMERRYPNIAALNEAWGASYLGFDALLSPIDPPETPAALRDRADFHRALVDRYGQVVSETLKSIDPHHLNLGMRYSHASDKTLCGPLTYFDVFSFNCYGAEPATAASKIGESVNLPMIVGEWHVGAQDSGLDAWGLYYTQTEAERAQAIAYYLEQSTQETHLTGVHYFEYCDQPYLGRFDGECYNIGVIDVCNRPYPKVAKALRDFAARMYPLLDGQAQPEIQPVALNKI